MPQGSVLGFTLFLTYVNDLESDLLSEVAKFADDTKLGGRVKCSEDCNKIQEDPIKLIDWSEKWLMSFNTDKCKVMHIGDNNPKFIYKMRDQELDNIKEEKDLGVIISCDFKMSDQCTAASKKANMMLSLISRNFDHKSPDSILHL